MSTAIRRPSLGNGRSDQVAQRRVSHLRLRANLDVAQFLARALQYSLRIWQRSPLIEA